MMVTIKFPDEESLTRGLGFLMERFSGSLFCSGEVIVPGAALEPLAMKNFSFTVLGKITPKQRAAKLRAAAIAASRK